ncbi:MAG: FtsX-like permease family protein [Myxococcales bacterium]|nr:FtsX-like permease family protein [Myxococcales bacterium]MCB9579614.1 FtsX-like permease family protein [Polyangiaceae bacterium]
MVKAVNVKLVRDLARLVGQVVTIALVVACGIASYVTMQSAFDSLITSRDRYYEQYRFGDVFAHLERAPLSLEKRLEDVPGVAQAEARVVEAVMVPMPNMPRPASGTLVSLPPDGQPALDAVYLSKGRMLDPKRSDEVLLLTAFADAHHIVPGDRVPVVINGTLRDLRVVGLAMSPEFVFTLPPGAMTYDPKQIAVLWMVRDAASAAFRMEGAFNDVVLRMQPGASERNVLEQVDRVLEPYGGVGAVPRSKQPSHFMLMGELSQLESMATVVPMIFLFVAAFLLNVVLSRLIHLQRPQIATLKAVGYADFEVGLHYLKLVSLVVLIGALIGLALGSYLGRALTDLYTGEYFRFPHPEFRLELRAVVVSISISLFAAVVGALSTVRAVTALPPAEAMRPPAPASYKRSLLERLGLFELVGPSTRMVLREVQRRPLRLALSSLGISMALGIVVVAGYWYDAMDYMLDVQFHGAMREDVTVTFIKPLPQRAVRELEHLPGVTLAEGLRSVPVRFRFGHRYRDAVINAYPEHLELRRLVNQEGRRVAIPEHGIVLTRTLAEVLKVKPGERVEVEFREGERKQALIPVVGTVDEAFGLQGHMRASALHAIMDEEPTVNQGLLRADVEQRDAIYSRLKNMPWVAAVASPRDFRGQFEAQSGNIIRVYTMILALFASIIAIGVVYNNARVALSQRNRDLASLRVLGFTRGEIAAILFGELSIQVLLAIPVGGVVGYWMVTGIASTVDPETYRLPVFISPRTYAYAAAVTVFSAVVSALLVRRKLDRLDLIGVLKTRE